MNRIPSLDMQCPPLDQIFSKEEECPTYPGDKGNLSTHEDTLLHPSKMDYPALCKIMNFYLGIDGSRGDHFTTGIAIESILDQEVGTQLIRVHLETRNSITINLGFVHFLTPTFNKEYTMNLIES